MTFRSGVSFTGFHLPEEAYANIIWFRSFRFIYDEKVFGLACAISFFLGMLHLYDTG
jgi:hypothetical protein